MTNNERIKNSFLAVKKDITEILKDLKEIRVEVEKLKKTSNSLIDSKEINKTKFFENADKRILRKIDLNRKYFSDITAELEKKIDEKVSSMELKSKERFEKLSQEHFELKRKFEREK